MKKIIFIGLVMGLSSVFVLAQDQQALQIVNQALQAHGGATVLLGIQDTIATGQARRFSQTIDQFSVTLTTMPGYMREDLTGIGMTRTYVKKGDYGWMSTNGRRKEIREEDLGNHLDERNPVISFFRLFLQNRFVLQYRGTMTVFGRQVYHLQALLADTDTVRRAVKYRIDRSYDIFVDTTTSFLVGYAFYDQSGPRVFTQTTISCMYSDYRPVGSVMFPFKTEIYVNSAKTFDITLTTLSINQGVSLSTFGMSADQEASLGTLGKSREWHMLNSELQPQTTDSSSVGVQPFGSYGGTQESINLYNGNVSRYLPLITLPGRNGFDYKVGLTYNSGGNWWYSLDSGGYAFRGTTNKRWKLIVPTLTWLKGSNGATWLDRYYITLPDGSMHEMRHIETDDPVLPPNPIDQMNPPVGRFRTWDSTHIELRRPQNVAYLADGTRIYFPSGWVGAYNSTGGTVNATQMEDVNGNIISFTYGPSPAVQLKTITDTLGRIITLTYSVPDDPSGVLTGISIKEADGIASRTYSIAADQSSITLPNNQQYLFQYTTTQLNNLSCISSDCTVFPYPTSCTFPPIPISYLSKITYPTGGYSTYTMGQSCQSANVVLTQKTVNAKDALGEIAWTYSGFYNKYVGDSGCCSQATSIVYRPDQSKEVHCFDVVANVEREVKTMSYGGTDTPPTTCFPIPSGSPTPLRTVDYVWQEEPMNTSIISSLPPDITYNKRIIKKTTTLEDGATQSKVEYDYDTNGYVDQNPMGTVTHTTGNIIALREFDYYTGTPPATPVRSTTRSYLTNSDNPDANSGYGIDRNHILNRMKSESIYSGASNPNTVPLAKTELVYDEYTAVNNHAPLLTRPGLTPFDSAYKAGATPLITARGNVTTIKTYPDPAGVPYQTFNQYDEAGNLIWTKDPRGNATSITFTADTSFAYPTTITPPIAQLAVNRTYAYNATAKAGPGLLTTETDPNGNTTSYSYDTMNRVTAVNRPDRGQTTYVYDQTDSSLPPPPPTSNTYDTQTTKLDSGNNFVQKTYFDGLRRTTKTVTADPDGDIRVDTTYDNMGRVSQVSNPYRQIPACTPNCYTTTSYDALSRITSVTTPDNQSVATAYALNAVTTTDQTGKRRKSQFDALGRLRSVWEDPAGLNYLTQYGYDALNNVTTITQDVQTRTFLYDGLSRLKTASVPEQVNTPTPPAPPTQLPTTYTYDENGNLLSKTFTKGGVSVTVSYGYDVLNRITSVGYTDGTPAVSYTYDNTTISNGKGLPYQVVANYSAFAGGPISYTATGYDAVGRLLEEKTGIRGVNFTTSYVYDWAGNLTSLTYPSNKRVTYTYSAATRVKMVGQEAQVDYYFRNLNYMPHGGVSLLQYGNGLTETRTYDANRLQLTTQVLPGSVTGGLMNLTYQYGAEQNTPCGANAYSGNNGNIYQIIDGTPRGLNYSFCYDALNRLKTAQVVGQPLQNYYYDRFGNMKKNDPNVAGFINPLTNRIAVTPYTYDEAGNLLNDGSHTYSYNAENRMTQIDNGATKYRYDGQGRRAEKESGLTWTFYLYEQSGNLISEYQAAVGSLVSTDLVCSTTVQPKYYHTDHLGSVRIVTDRIGQLVAGSQKDFYPYGEEIQQPPTANNQPKFAGYYRDAETGLDHTWLRKYSPVLGRWMSPDLHPGSIDDPQSLNRYSYVQNSPMNFIDPAGLSRRDYGIGGEGPRDFDVPAEFYIDGLRVSRSFGLSFLARAFRGILPGFSNYYQTPTNGSQGGVDTTSTTGAFTIETDEEGNTLISGMILISSFQGQIHSSAEGKDLGLGLLAEIAGFIPVVGNLLSLGEGVAGRDLSGNKLTGWDRGLAFAGIIPGIGNAGRVVRHRKLIKAIVKNASKLGVRLSDPKIAQLKRVVEKAGGTLRTEIGNQGSVKGILHSQVEGFGSKTAHRHIIHLNQP